MVSASSFVTFNWSHCLDFALLFMECKLRLISLIIVNVDKKLPNANEIIASVKCIEHQSNKHSKLHATTYPIGLFVSNGKLLCQRTNIFDLIFSSGLTTTKILQTNESFHSLRYKWQIKGITSCISGEVCEKTNENFWYQHRWLDQSHCDHIYNITPFLNLFIGFDVHCFRFWISIS